MNDDDLETRLRRMLHAELDGTEPASPAPVPGGTRGSRIRGRSGPAPLGLLAAITSIVIVAALVGPRLAGPGGTPATAGSAPAGSAPAGAIAPAGGSPVQAGPGTSGTSPSTAPAAGIASPAVASSAAPGPIGTPPAPVPAATRVAAATATPGATHARPTPSASPAPSPTATTSGETTGSVVVTLADADGPVMLAVGQRLVLQLGTTYDWVVSVDGTGVLAPVTGALQPGQQGAWIAERAGTALIRIVGNPPCLQAKPPCLMPSRVLTITVTVA